MNCRRSILSYSFASVLFGLIFQPLTPSYSLDQFPIGEAWARTNINCVIFRKNAICTHENVQYAAYYDAQVWQTPRKIHLLTQFVGQGDSES